MGGKNCFFRAMECEAGPPSPRPSPTGEGETAMRAGISPASVALTAFVMLAFLSTENQGIKKIKAELSPEPPAF
jgi:hypothetical protein